MSVRHAVFFRNVNLGRPHSPSRAQLEQAFLEAGARHASSFLVNGTLVFEAGQGARPRGVVARACEALRGTCGLREPAFVRSLDELAAIVASEPFAGIDLADVHECCVTFLSSDVELAVDDAGRAIDLPSRTARGDVEVVRARRDAVFSLSRVVGRSPGSPNAFVERALGRPATTRHWNTVSRVVRRFG